MVRGKSSRGVALNIGDRLFLSYTAPTIAYSSIEALNSSFMVSSLRCPVEGWAYFFGVCFLVESSLGSICAS